MSDSQASASKPGLSRVLGLWSLVIYGTVLVQPTAPMSPFGVVSVKAEGHVVTTILIGMVAMLFTAISYRPMAAEEGWRRMLAWFREREQAEKEKPPGS